MEGIGDQHPALVAITLLNFLDEFLVVWEGAGDSHALHVSSGEGIDESFFLIHGLAESLGNEIGQADPQGVALGLGGKTEGGNNLDVGVGEILMTMNASPADDIGVHTGAAEGFSDFIDNEDVEFLGGKGRKVVAMALEKGRFLG